MKAYRRKEYLVLTAFIVMSVGLLLVGCPNPCDSSTCPHYDPSGGQPGGGSAPQPKDLEAQKLGLISNETGTAILIAMRSRWAIANPESGTSSDFYPFDTLSTGTVSGLGLKHALLMNTVPIRFHISGNNMTAYATSGSSSQTSSIWYDVVIIRESDGKGWFTEGAVKNIPAGIWPTSATRVQDTPISLSRLSGGTNDSNGGIASISGLNGYEVYAIIRTRGSSSDYNSTADRVRNVIKIYPDPEP